eukprot:699311-Pyramimonas_sp.AAC.1
MAADTHLITTPRYRACILSTASDLTGLVPRAHEKSGLRWLTESIGWPSAPILALQKVTVQGVATVLRSPMSLIVAEGSSLSKGSSGTPATTVGVTIPRVA